MLTLRQVEDVCFINDPAKLCRYIDTSSGVYCCLKKVSIKKKKIDDQVKKFIDKATKNGQDPDYMQRPIGDNCSGYIYLKTVPQGYDQP